jgi:hypothetical protein
MLQISNSSLLFHIFPRLNNGPNHFENFSCFSAVSATLSAASATPAVRFASTPATTVVRFWMQLRARLVSAKSLTSYRESLPLFFQIFVKRFSIIANCIVQDGEPLSSCKRHRIKEQLRQGLERFRYKSAYTCLGNLGRVILLCFVQMLEVTLKFVRFRKETVGLPRSRNSERIVPEAYPPPRFASLKSPPFDFGDRILSSSIGVR